MDIFEQDKQYIAATYGRFPVAIESGSGSTLYGADGKVYIDFTSGIGVCSLGHCDEGLIAAVSAQLHKLWHISNLYYTEPCVLAARTLCERTGMSRVFFCNSGAESNEGAIKAARKYSFDKYGAGRSGIVALVNSFHGRTVTTLSATGQDVFHNYFFPFTEGFTYAQPGDIADMEAHITGETCAVMLELIQGEGGVVPLDAAYVQAVAGLCAERDVLLIIDEVQTGVGRTGSLYCFQQFGIKPDIVTSAKGIAGGLPLAAVLFNEKTGGVLTPGTHATTFGGNPVACAAANEVLSRLDEAFLNDVTAKGDYIREQLAGMKHVTGVCGRGLMIGASLDGVTSRDAVAAGIELGVLALTAKEKLRLLPPLNISRAEIDRGLEALSMALESI